MNKFPVPLLRQLLGCMQDGLSIRVTAQKLGISKPSVSLLSQTALSHGGGANVAELIQLPDTHLLETFYPSTTKAYQEPDWVEVHKKLARRNVTLKLLYDAYKSLVVRRPYTYTSFCRRYSEWRQTNGLGVPNGNVQAIPGERMEIDFAGDNLKWIDPNCEAQRARLFIAVLPYSNLTYAEAFPNEKQQSWISGIVHALEYFGGTPQVLVMDNAKALVKHESWYEGEVQQTVRSLCNNYDIEPWACQPRRPKQKNRVEAGVGLAERRIIAAMELERTPMARDLDHLNEQVKAKLEALNNTPFTATERSNSRRQMFEDEEREFLGRLPLQTFCPLDIRVLVVDRGHCVRISGDGHRYSTPPEYTGKRVSVTITDDKVYIYDLDSWGKIAEHVRYKNPQGNKTHLLPEHLTDAERKYRRQPREWVAEFVKAGLPEDFADHLVRHLKKGKTNFPYGRACNALMRLFKLFPVSIIYQALSTRLEYGNVTYQETRKRCEQLIWAKENNLEPNIGNDQRIADDYLSPAHANIRNNYR